MIAIELPYPPTVNTYWRHVGRKVLISRKGREYRDTVGVLLMANRVRCQAGRLCVEVDVYPPDERTRDLDNILKALLDSLGHGRAYDDDSQIDQIVLTRIATVKGGGVVVRIYARGKR